MISTVDLNIVIDVFANRALFIAESRAVLNLIEKRVIIGVFASHAITTLYYAMRKSAGASRAEDAVEYVLDYFQVWGAGRDDWRPALAWGFRDFEDAAIAKVAELSNSQFIVTRNGADFLKSPVPTITPAELVQLIQSPIL